MYFADSRWWRWHKNGIAKPSLRLSAAEVAERYAGFQGERVTIAPTGMEIDEPAVHMLKNADVELKENAGLSLKAGAILTGRNSGYQALNIAVLAGARRIALLGYDMRFKDGKAHWFGDHPVKNTEAEFATYAKRFRSTLPQLKEIGVEVLNCSPISLIDAFPKVTIEAALA